MTLTFIEILWLIIAIVISIIAIKITFTFDINRYLENNQNNIRNKIKNYCTHAYIGVEDDNIKCQSAFISPSGTLNYVCQKCGMVLMTMDHKEESKRIQKLLENPAEYKKQERKFEKLLKKGGFI